MKKLLITKTLLIIAVVSFGQLYPTNDNSPVYASQTIDGKVYFFGGQNSNVATDVIRYYDITENSWHVLDFTLPYPLYDYINATYSEGSFYLSPGFTSGNNNGWGSHNKIIKVDLSSQTAAEVLAYGTYGTIWNISNVKVGDDIIFSGGHNGSDQNGIYKYTPSTNTLDHLATMIVGRNSHKLIYGSDGMVYILGDKAAIEKLNPISGEIITLASEMPSDAIANYNPICWHLKSKGLVYFFRHGVNQTLYKFDYLNDIVESTGVSMEKNYSYQHIADAENENVIFVLENIDTSDAYMLTRLDLIDYVDVLGTTSFNTGNHKIYPNPTTDQLHVVLNEFNIQGVIEVYDVFGAIIYYHRFSSNSFQINTSMLEDGIYFLKLKDKDGNALGTSKFVKH